MDPNYLDFEQPIAELEAKISELRLVGSDNDLNIGEEIQNLRAKSTKLTEKIYSNLSSWQISQVAGTSAFSVRVRVPRRAYFIKYIQCNKVDSAPLQCNRLRIIISTVDCNDSWVKSIKTFCLFPNKIT